MKNFSKYTYIIFALLTICSYAQNKEANIIILIDGKVVKYAYGKINTSEGVINCTILAGKIQVDESDYNELKDKQINDFQFSYSVCDITKIYKIDDFKLNWFEQSIILYIYNTDNKIYRKIYNPLQNQTYTYEYDCEGVSMKRVTKKHKDNKCE